MGKFDGILLCTDIDKTLLNDKNEISTENRNAIEYFKSEGGLFSYVTGRNINASSLIFENLEPNAPMIIFNGAGVYDTQKKELLEIEYVDRKHMDVIEFVEKHIPGVAVDFVGDTLSYYYNINHLLADHRQFERGMVVDIDDYRALDVPIVKTLFMADADVLSKVRQLIAESEYADMFEYVQSTSEFYEVLPKNSNKGTGLEKLAKLVGIPMNKTIAVGDNGNDIQFIQKAGVGIAVANAIPELLSCADCITVDNNSHALKAIIESLDGGTISL